MQFPMRPFIVSGRSKPACAGRLKTSHFEETQIRRLGSRVNPLSQVEMSA